MRLSWRSLTLPLICAVLALAPARHTMAAEPVHGGPAEKRFITISTGGFYSVYYPLGSAICRMVNQRSAEHHLYCSIRRSGGPTMNIDRLRRGEVNFAIVSSDTLRLAAGGSTRFATSSPFDGLRGVLALYSEQLVLLAGRAAPGPASFRELRGKRLAIGPANSDTSAAFDYLSQVYGVQEADFGSLMRIDEAHQLDALCEGTVDGLVHLGGNPNRLVERALGARCGARLLMIEPGTRANLIARQPQLQAAVIPMGAYNGLATDVPTVGMMAVLVTEARVPESVVAILVRAVVDDLPTLRRAHPVMAGRRREDLLPRLPFLPNAPSSARLLVPGGEE